MLTISIISLAITLIGLTAKAVITTSTILSLKDLCNIDNVSDIKGFDEAYVGITSQAIDMLAKFMQYAQLLVMGCACLALIFYCFKLWSGTIELKKFFVESILKCTVVLVLMYTYPAVVTKVYTLSTELGVEASGGEETLLNCFGSLAEKLCTFWDAAAEEMLLTLQDGGDTKDGKIVISNSILKKFEDCGLNQSETEQWLKSKGFVAGETSAKGFFAWKNDQKIKEKKIKKSLNDKAVKARMKQTVSILRNLSEVLTGINENEVQSTEVSIVDMMTMGNKALENVFYNPYIKDTKQLSVSTLCKTAIIIGEIASSGALAPLETDSTNETEVSTENMIKGKKPRTVIKILGIFGKYFVYKISLIIGVILIMIEYIVTLIEYLIVAAVSSLFIPLYFIDATKQYTTNILKSILSYFIKILVTTMMIFFVLGMWINMGSYVCGLDLSSTVTIVYYLFNIVLGITLCKSAGKIAGAVISGNPSMGIGDIANQMRSFGHMYRTAQHAAHQAGQDIKNTASKAQKVGHNADVYGANRDAAKRAASTTKDSVESDLRSKAASGEWDYANNATPEQLDKMVAKAGKEAYKNSMKNSMREFGKDQLHSVLTGGMARRGGAFDGEGSLGRLQIGQEFMAKDGTLHKASFKDVQDRNEELAKLAGKNTVEDYLKAKAEEGKSNQRRQDKDWPEPGL